VDRGEYQERLGQRLCELDVFDCRWAGGLLDIPRLRGVRWLEPGEHIFGDELEAAERAQASPSAKGTSC
jgi:hypothetical protein